jgi:hypothetical protein
MVGSWCLCQGRSLTGYDNRDAVSGQPDEEVYLYHAVVVSLVCVSCNPIGCAVFGAVVWRGGGAGWAVRGQRVVLSVSVSL